MFGIFRRKKFPLVAFAIKVISTSSSSWQTSVREVLNKTRGVSRFSIWESGYVQVVGTVKPEKLGKKLAKAGTRGTGVYVYLDPDYSYGTAGHYNYGGTAWLRSNGYVVGYPVNDYPATTPAAN